MWPMRWTRRFRSMRWPLRCWAHCWSMRRISPISANTVYVRKLQHVFFYTDVIFADRKVIHGCGGEKKSNKKKDQLFYFILYFSIIYLFSLFCFNLFLNVFHFFFLNIIAASKLLCQILYLYRESVWYTVII